MEEERLAEAGADGKIGTTGRGIGPCYQDKVGRRFGIRVGELLRPDHLRERLKHVVSFKNRLLTAFADCARHPQAVRRRPGLRRVPRLRRPHQTLRHRHLAAAAGRPQGQQARAVRGRARQPARRGPRDVPVCHQFEQPAVGHLGRGGCAVAERRPDHRRGEGVHDPRGPGAVPHRAGRRPGRHRRADPQGRPGVWHRHRPAAARAAGSTRWPSATPRRCPGPTRSPSCCWTC